MTNGQKGRFEKLHAQSGRARGSSRRRRARARRSLLSCSSLPTCATSRRLAPARQPPRCCSCTRALQRHVLRELKSELAGEAEETNVREGMERLKLRGGAEAFVATVDALSSELVANEKTRRCSRKTRWRRAFGSLGRCAHDGSISRDLACRPPTISFSWSGWHRPRPLARQRRGVPSAGGGRGGAARGHCACGAAPGASESSGARHSALMPATALSFPSVCSCRTAASGIVAFYEAGATLEQVRAWVVTAYPADAPMPLPPWPLRSRRRPVAPARPRSSLTSPTGS